MMFCWLGRHPSRLPPFRIQAPPTRRMTKQIGRSSTGHFFANQSGSAIQLDLAKSTKQHIRARARAAGVF